jgi:hypothetical protein
MVDEVGGLAGGTSCRDVAGLVPASRGAHCRPLHPRLASLCPVQRYFHSTILSDYEIFANSQRDSGPGRTGTAGEEVVQVEIGSGTQVASRGPTWRRATPRYGMGATAYPRMALCQGG